MTPQPCENCGATRAHDDDMYQRARPGSKAMADGYRFERLCADCRPDVRETGGGPWGDPPPSRPPKPRRGRR
jgi:hypothetical protein